MLSRILGLLLVILGLLWTIKPDMLRNRIKRKMNRKMKWLVFGFVLFFGFLLIGSAIKAEGLIAKIIVFSSIKS